MKFFRGWFPCSRLAGVNVLENRQVTRSRHRPAGGELSKDRVRQEVDAIGHAEFAALLPQTYDVGKAPVIRPALEQIHIEGIEKDQQDAARHRDMIPAGLRQEHGYRPERDPECGSSLVA